MSWIDIIWIADATLCLALATVHGAVWVGARGARANGFFVLVALASAAFAFSEHRVMRASSAEEMGTAIRWAHAPLCVLVVASLCFTITYLKAGRTWLAWTICGLRVAALIINFSCTPNLNFHKITSIQHLRFLGEMVSVPLGLPNPWMLVGQLGSIFFIVFLVDVTWTVWRRGDAWRRRLLGLAFAICFSVPLATYAMVFWGIRTISPYYISLLFLGVVVIMGVELTWDLLQAVKLAEALKASEEKYRKIFENVQDVFFQTDLSGKIFEISPSIEKYCGYSREELLGQPVQRLYQHPENRAGLLAALRTGGQVVDFELQLRTKGGQLLYVSLNARERLDAAGKRFGLEGSLRDITLKRQIQDSLKRSERKFSTIFEENPVAMAVSEIDTGRFLQVNASLARTMRGTAAQLIGRTSLEIGMITKENRDRLQNQIKTNGRVEGFITEMRRLDGEVFTADLYVVPFELEGSHVLLTSLVDITERKRAAENQARLGAIVQSSLDGIISKNLDGIITTWNPGAEKLFGYAAAEIVGTSIMRLIPAERMAEENDILGRISRGENVMHFDTVRLLKGGQLLDVSITASPVRDPNGDIVGISKIVRDVSERKRAEEHIRRLTVFPALNPNPVLEFSPDGTLTYYNQATLDLSHALGLSGVAALLPPRVEEMVRRCLDANQPQLREEIVHGSRILSASFYPIRKVNTVHCYMVDITERKRMEATLREREALLHLFVEHSPAAIAMFDGHMNYLVVSRRWLKDYGLAGQSLVGRNHYDVFPEIPERWRQIHRRCLAGASEKCDQEAFVRSDGTTQYIRWEIQPWQQADGTIGGIIIFSEDTTELNRADEQMSAQIGALTAAANAIVLTNRQGKIEWVNPAFTKLTGYSAEEMKGRNPRVLKSGEHPPAFYSNMWATILTGNVWHGELVNKRKDGRLYTEEMTITSVRGADGQIAHFVAVKQDITERRQMEKRLIQAQKMEAIGTLAGGIAHDFNNILAAMFGYAHLLQQDTVGNLLAQESVVEILTAANRAKELVQQILSFSRQREQQPQVLKLDMIIKEVIKFLRASLPAHIKIEKELAAETPAVLADPTQIYQVIMNLATNALHAMEDGPGRLRVHLNPVQPDEKLIQTHPQLKPILYACLTVADTGHGMDARTLEHIFEPFFTTKPVGKGTGLGLAVVHGIVASHNGVITVESQVGQGTTFTLYFPAQGKTVTLSAVNAGEVPHGHGQKILVLDDETALTSVLQKMLRRLDYEATTSNRAGEVVNLVRENPARFDLVITDLTMPEMNGLEVAKQIRAIRPDLPVILVSGYSASVGAERLREVGICERLEKPISPFALAKVLERVLKQSGESRVSRPPGIKEQQNGPSVEPADNPHATLKNESEIPKT